MCGPQWVGRASGRGTGVVVLVRQAVPYSNPHICYLFSFTYRTSKGAVELQKVLPERRPYLCIPAFEHELTVLAFWQK